MTGANAEVLSKTSKVILLQYISCIWYLVQFREDPKEVKALVKSGSEVNAMTPVYAIKLGFAIGKTNIGAQKIDDSLWKTYNMTTTDFLL